MAAGLDSGSAEALHEVADREPFADALCRVLLASRVEHDDTPGHEQGSERNVRRHGDIAWIGMLHDVAISHVRPTIDAYHRRMHVARWHQQPLVRDEERLEREAIRCPEADLLHIAGRGVGIEPELHRERPAVTDGEALHSSAYRDAIASERVGRILGDRS